jgi:TonB family protein
VKHRDTSLLLFGAATAVLMPWNPVVWWMVRRLRTCVEQDCDARVLANHPDVRRYADLLLTAASRKGAGGLLAAHLGERSSDLLRRLEAMTIVKRIPWSRTLAATLVAVVLVIASCEAPRPDPLSPAAEASPSPAATTAFTETKPATMLEGSPMPVYPAILREAGVEGEVLVSFVVNESGEVDPSKIRIIRSTHELFAAAVRKALPAMRFIPAESNGRKTSQTQEQPFTFSLVGNKTQRPQDSSEVEILGVPGKKLAHTDRQADITSRTLKEKAGAGQATPDGQAEREIPTPSVLLRGSKSLSQAGSPLVIVDGVVMTGKLDDIDPQTIFQIEVIKGAAAKLTYGERAQDGVIQIMTKSGRRVP